MSIEFIAGKPGAGKSLLSVSFVIEELVNGRRIVVTNLPLKLDFLNEYIQKHHPAASVDLTTRVRILNEEEFGQFFRYRENSAALEIEVDAKTGKPLRCDYSKISASDVGVFYVLDELHIAFNSRAWMSTGPAALYYLSQHRKLGDDVFCITQSTANVDKQFRSVAQEFHQVRNLSKERWGMLRGPQKFQVKTFLQQPTSELAVASRTTHFVLSLDMAGCYDTAAGVGVVGRSGADVGQKKKGGLPFWAVWVVFGVLAVGVVAAPWALTKGFKAWNSKKDSSRAEVKPSPSPAAPSGGEFRRPGSSLNSLIAKPVGVESDRLNPQTESDLYVRGMVIRGDRVNVSLSDGRTLTEGSAELQSIERGAVNLRSGAKLWVRAAPRPAGAGGGSPPDRRRAEAAADAIAVPTGQDLTGVADREAAMTLSSGEPQPQSQSLKSSGQSLVSSARTAQTASGFRFSAAPRNVPRIGR